MGILKRIYLGKDRYDVLIAKERTADSAGAGSPVDQAVEAVTAAPPPEPDTSDAEASARAVSTYYAQGKYAEAWSQRLALGLGFSEDQVQADTFFWANAHGALAALATGQRHHPLTATAAGYAESSQAHGGPTANAVVAEIKAKYFG